MWKSLEQIGNDYAEAAAPIRATLKALRAEIEAEQDPQKRHTLKYKHVQLQNILHDLILYERWCKGYYTKSRRAYEEGYTSDIDARRRQQRPKLNFSSQIEKRAVERGYGSDRE